MSSDIPQIRLENPPRHAAERIGLLSRNDFQRACQHIPELCDYPAYDDWISMREGFHLGLCAAGVNVDLVPVSLDVFLAWCSLRDLTPCETLLDQFAAGYAPREHDGLLQIEAIFPKFEFTIWRQRIHGLWEFPTFEDYCASLVASGKFRHAERPPMRLVEISLGAFRDWATCLGLPTGAREMRTYARLLVELEFSRANGEDSG